MKYFKTEHLRENGSGIVYLKSRFFIYRIIGYFSFLLIPIWVTKTFHLNHGQLYLMMALYIVFMMGQWFLLGKEIDHFLNIYFKINSSIDRTIYRLFLGLIFFIIYFNLLSFLPNKWIYNCFWITWVILGLFYSWPTRGKIIQESISTDFNEFRYLDSFEKTLLILTSVIYFFSVPELSLFTNIDAFKLFLDPLEKINSQFWNFLTVNYYPFKKYPLLLKIAWTMHFYLVGTGLFLVAFYALLRLFFSRRLSLLGIFAFLSSWSFSKILANSLGDAIVATYSLLWVWTTLWVIKSTTYKSGLFLGLMGHFGFIINQSFVFLTAWQFFLLNYFFLNEYTSWLKKKLVKYTLPGCILIICSLFFTMEEFYGWQLIEREWPYHLIDIVKGKAFFSLSVVGLLILILYLQPFKNIKNIHLDETKLKIFSILLGSIFIHGILFNSYLIKSFSFMWIVTFLSLLPLELVFRSIGRPRSGRNLIYLVYILICLLDSHFEGRIKIFMRLFNS